MPLQIIREDIKNMRTDAIINPSNKYLKKGGGTSHIVFETAGADKLQKACDELAPINLGEAVITPAFNFPVKYIIHTAGPKYDSNKIDESIDLLKKTYQNALLLAAENGCRSIAFPLLSSGSYHFPKEIALKTARSAISNFLEDHEMDIYLLVFDNDSFKVSNDLIGEVKSYISENYVDSHIHKRGHNQETYGLIKHRSESSDFVTSKNLTRNKLNNLYSEDSMPDVFSAPSFQAKATLPVGSAVNETLFKYLEDSFATTLMNLIDKKGKTDAEVYKKANIDRKLFSKIRSKKDYTPTKTTILALAISLELSLKETQDLLRRAGYALSRSNKFDLIIEFFIGKQEYNIFEINEVLFSFDQPQLGSKNN